MKRILAVLIILSFFSILPSIAKVHAQATPRCGSGNNGCVRAMCEVGNYDCAFCVTSPDSFSCDIASGHSSSWECRNLGSNEKQNIWGSCSGFNCTDSTSIQRGQTYCNNLRNPPTATPPPAATSTPTPSPTPTTIPTPTPIPDPPPFGWDGLACSVGQSTGTSSGWACDPSDYSVPLLVDTFVDGAWIYRTLANGSWPGVAGACNGYDNHAFSVAINPAYFADNQAHQVQSYAVNIGTNGPYWTLISDWTGTNHAAQACSSYAGLIANPTSCQIPYYATSCSSTLSWDSRNEGAYLHLYQNSNLVYPYAPYTGTYTSTTIPPGGATFDLKSSEYNPPPGRTLASAFVNATQLHAIFGNIGLDTNNNGYLEGNEMLDGIRIGVYGNTSGSYQVVTSALDSRFGRGNGFFSLENIPGEVYSIGVDTASLPTNVDKTRLPNTTIDLSSPANRTDDRQYILHPIYTIRGTVFVDTNVNHVYDPGTDPVYTGSFSIGTSTGGTVSYNNTAGAYTISNATTTQNQYIQYSGIPDGYLATTPTTQSTNPCFTSPTGECTINFGIINSTPWYQTKGLDVRVDPWQKDVIPSQSVCANQPHVSTLNANQTPGVTFGGSVNQTFGAGSASVYNWQVGSSQYPEKYTPIRRTSISYVRQTIKQQNMPLVGLNSFSGCGNYADCRISGIPSGTQAIPKVYVADNGANVNLSADTVNITSGSVVIIVTGTLTINGEIHVAPGASLTFITGNIIIAPSIGSSPTSCSPAPNLEGLYSADGSITIQSTANCAANIADKQLSVAGALVANAGKAGGTLRMNRDMCLDNVTFPSITISERPDLALTLPLILQQNYSLFKEVAP